MPRSFSRRLVIDACVAQASGGEAATDPMSKQCRDFLKMVLDISHRIVLTPAIQTEWRKHQSRYSAGWLSTMQRKGKVVRTNSGTDTQLRRKMEVFAINSGLNVEEVLKDIHLVEAATETDEIIVSCEKYARRQYAKAARGEVGEIGRVAWISPCNKDEQPLEWLSSGARSEEYRRLGCYDAQQ